MVIEKSINLLNELIEINSDRIEWYDTASKETDEDDLKALFSQLIQTCEKCKTQLSNEVLKLGGTPVVRTSSGGLLFWVWLDVKASQQLHKAILNSCEEGEDVAVDAYKKILRISPEDITTHQRTLLHSQLQLRDNDRNSIRELRNKLVVA